METKEKTVVKLLTFRYVSLSILYYICYNKKSGL